MDDSTEDVTLLSGFVFDVLQEYEGMKRICAPIFSIAEKLDRAKPEQLTAMSTYNEICDWVEANVGRASIRDAGRAIGNRAFDSMVKSGTLPDTSPSSMMQALKWAASTMIQDPKRRGWDIQEDSPRKIVMKRTQTFNCVLQEGLLLSLLERTGVLMPSVRHATCTRQGDEFCTYELTWLQKRG